MHTSAPSCQAGADQTGPDNGWIILLTLCLAVLMVQIDTTVVNLAARSIGDSFAAGTSALQWVVDSYNLVYAALLLTGGLLADLYGRRRVFVAGAVVFTTASMICAVAPSIPILIGGRLLAGVSAALVVPASLAIIRVVWPDPTERGRALGVWAACNGLALAIGPTIGGVLIDRFGWRSVFLVVVPLGLAAFGLALGSVPDSSDPHERRFDLLAQVLGALALGGLAVAAIESRGAPLAALIALIIAALAVALFVRVEMNSGPAALVPLDMFHIAAFRGAMAATAGMTFGMYGVLFLLPLRWQSASLLSAVGAGLALIPMALVFVLVSPLSGALAGRFGTRLMTAGGVAIIGCGLMLIGATAGAASIIAAELGLALTGLGMGLATGPLMGIAVASVGSKRSGTAASLINVARMVGATVGVAVLGTVYSSAGGGADGLRIALLLGGFVQLAGAAAAWTAIPSGAPPPPRS